MQKPRLPASTVRRQVSSEAKRQSSSMRPAPVFTWEHQAPAFAVSRPAKIVATIKLQIRKITRTLLPAFRLRRSHRNGFGDQQVAGFNLAPGAGFEPATNRLTAGCSTTELPGNSRCYGMRPITKPDRFAKHRIQAVSDGKNGGHGRNRTGVHGFAVL